MLSKNDVIRLQDAAIRFNEQSEFFGVAECSYLYRDKPEEYFVKIFSEFGGIMKTYLKDAGGDLRSPINGEIYGLFFRANVKNGKPFESSPFGDTRVLICIDEVLGLTPNMFFADFYCMQSGSGRHVVTIVLTKTGSSADEFCNRCLPRLDLDSNPFLCKAENGQIFVSSDVFVEVFVTEDLNVSDMRKRGVAEMNYGVPSTGILGKTSQGGQAGAKAEKCVTCNVFQNRLLAYNLHSYELY